MTDPTPPPTAVYAPPLTAQAALDVLRAALPPGDRAALLPPLQALLDGAPEIECPNPGCGATIRARMADHPDVDAAPARGTSARRPALIELRASHVIDRGVLGEWLADHGVNAHETMSAVVRVDRRYLGAWLDVEFYLLDHRGVRFADETGERAATASVSVPLHSWPPLVEPPTG